jgi:alpha-galactosidase
MHSRTSYRQILCLLTTLFAVFAATAALPGGQQHATAAPVDKPSTQLAKTPPMGWNNWNLFGRNVNEKLIKEHALAIHTNGMQSAGYKYVNIDDAWMAKERDENGHLVPDPVRFPHGIKAVADYVRRLPRQLRSRGHRRTGLRGLGRRLSQVRQLLHRTWHR